MKPLFMKKFDRLGMLALVSLAFISIQCSKYHGELKEYTVNSALNGEQVVPLSVSSASGLIVGDYNKTLKNTLTGTLSWTGLSGPPTAIHIHFAGAGSNNNNPGFEIQKFPKSAAGSIKVQSVFTQALENGITGNGCYFDIHTASYPQGEIRGQIIVE